MGEWVARIDKVGGLEKGMKWWITKQTQKHYQKYLKGLKGDE